MRKVFVPALLALALSSAPARADGCGFGFKWNISGSLCASISPCAPSCGPCGGGGGGGGGPWYGYYPMEAYFNASATRKLPSTWRASPVFFPLA